MNRQFYIFLIFFLCIEFFYSQEQDDFLASFLVNQQFDKENIAEQLRSNNYSKLFNSCDHPTYGFYGENKERIYVKILSVTKDLKNPKEYFVFGKTKRNKIIRPFLGKIVIQKNYKTQSVKSLSPLSSKQQGVIIAKYVFYENNKKSNVFFEGTLYSKWYINDIDEVKYDSRNIFFDRFSNNAFIGNMVVDNNSITCNRGDYFPPEAGDLSTGITYFIPNSKYKNHGWY